MKVSNAKNKFIVLCTCVIYVMLLQGFFMRPLYGPDMYNAMADPAGYYNAALYGSGRFVHAFYFWFIAQIGQNLSWVSAYYISFMLNLLFLVTATFRYSNMIADILEIGNNNYFCYFATAVLSCITIDNIFISEFFLYPESIFVLVTWINVEAVAQYCKLCKDNKKWRHIIIIALLMLSGFGYQIIPCVYFVLTLPLVMVKSKSIRSFIVNQFETGVHYLLGAIPGSLFAKYVVNSPRVKFQQESISEKLYEYKPHAVDTKSFILDRVTSAMLEDVLSCCA